MDGRTDRQTEFSSLDRVCIPCSAVKICLLLFLTSLQRNLVWSFSLTSWSASYDNMRWDWHPSDKWSLMCLLVHRKNKQRFCMWCVVFRVPSTVKFASPGCSLTSRFECGVFHPNISLVVTPALPGSNVVWMNQQPRSNGDLIAFFRLWPHCLIGGLNYYGLTE